MRIQESSRIGSLDSGVGTLMRRFFGARAQNAGPEFILLVNQHRLRLMTMRQEALPRLRQEKVGL